MSAPSWFMDLDSLLQAVGGERLFQKQTVFSGVGTDSRKDLKGRIFFALSGQRFNGHDFLSSAVRRGAVCLIVSEALQDRDRPSPVTLIKVPDTLKALQDLSVYWRKKLNLKIIAVTGSCGKTTVKGFSKTLLTPLRAFAGPKSYNNHFGVPLSLLEVTRPESFVIQELGVSGPGEMAPLCRLCDPVISLVTGVAPAHLEGFQSLTRLVEEKKQIYRQSLKADWIFNRDNLHTEAMYQELQPLRLSGAKTLTFSRDPGKKADIQLKVVEQSREGMKVEGSLLGVRGTARLSFSGSHNAENLMSACGAALLCGMSPGEIWDRLPLCQTPEGRGKWFVTPEGISVLFDAYNANPLSMKAFFESFNFAGGRRFFILGDMKELGGEAETYHSALAEYSALRESEFLWCIGDYGQVTARALRAKGWKGTFWSTENYEKDRMEDFKKFLKKGDLAGIKGSRGFKLERAFLDLTGQTLSF